MGLIDRIVSAFSPRAAAEREAWKQAYSELKKSGYDGGNGGRLNSSWDAVIESAENTDRYERDTVRARCRDLERNSDIAGSILSAYKRNIIGKGFQLQARTEDKELNDKLETLWKRWTKARNCDVTGAQSFTQLLRMAVERKKIDGGILFVKRYTAGGLVPFKLQMMEVDELDLTVTTPKNNSDKVSGGIEYNSYNRPVGYFFRQYRIDGTEYFEKPVYVSANDVIFYYTKRRPSQIREMSDMASVLTRIRDTTEFETAVSVKERIAACLAVFIKKSLPVSGLGGRSAQKDTGAYPVKSLTPGMIRELNPGDEIQVVEPSGTGSDAAAFIKLQQRTVGAGQGLSYEAVSRDMSETNYASARQASIEDEMTYYEEIETLTESVLPELYETFVISCVLAGLIDIPEFFADMQKWFAHGWVSSPKKWIDPYKEANANKIALETGQKTFKQICAEGGKDWQEQIDDIAETEEYALEKLGRRQITLPADTLSAATEQEEGGDDADGQEE